jgi:hypothetical protein
LLRFSNIFFAVIRHTHVVDFCTLSDSINNYNIMVYKNYFLPKKFNSRLRRIITRYRKSLRYLSKKSISYNLSIVIVCIYINPDI